MEIYIFFYHYKYQQVGSLKKSDVLKIRDFKQQTKIPSKIVIQNHDLGMNCDQLDHNYSKFSYYRQKRLSAADLQK